MSSNRYTIAEMQDMLRVLWADPTLPGTILISPPGRGKSTIVEGLAKEMGLKCITMMANIRDPSDFAGLPVAKGDHVEMLPLDWAMALKDQDAVLFLDEINTARPATIAALLRVALDRVVGNVYLGPRVRIVAAMNPPEEAAHGWELPPALANRFFHFTLRETPVSQWKAWATDAADSPELKELVASFDVESLDEPATSGPFASPRSWFAALRGAARAHQAGRADLAAAIVTAAVGPGAAIAWNARHTKDAIDWTKELAPDLVRRAITSHITACKEGKHSWDTLWPLLSTGADHNAATLYVVLSEFVGDLSARATSEAAQAALNKINNLVHGKA